jgi:serine/threonine-protein kinase RsbT
MTPASVVRVPIRDESDLAVARRRVREFAARHGLSDVAIEALATAVTEVARNVLDHAGAGMMWLGPSAREEGGDGIVVSLHDDGPGIRDVALAMQDGYTTRGGLGLGLPSARSLVDDFRIESEPGRGTTVTMWKWSS